MKHDLHPWHVTPAEAVAIQQRLRGQVRVEPLDVPALRTVAGCDLSAEKDRGEVFVGIVVLSLPGLGPVEEVALSTRTEFPYVPGLLSFREVPAILEAWERLRGVPDVLILDGHGLAHPRRFGLACHAGLVLERPAVGCAKRRFVGTHAEPGAERGATAELRDGDEVIGAVVRTKTACAPVYASIGQRCRLADAVELLLACDGGYRIPEPTRRAHLLVNRLRRGER
ncbi:MAG: endonuclease V [Armatimonadetes bacterium]|nr:endonuclease V [Armatimonadota bacterium]